MKFNALIKLCKASKQIVVYNDGNGGQWISDGRAIYPLNNLPTLTRENIFRIMDVPEDKQDKFFYKEEEMPDEFSFSDTDAAENPLEPGKVAIAAKGILFRPVRTQEGISFINQKHLAPFADEENGCQLFERVSKTGRVYIAVKVGFILSGIIVPYAEVITKDFASELGDIATYTMIACSKIGDSEQIGLFDDEEDDDESENANG